MREIYTKEQVAQELAEVIKDLSTGGLYAPMMSRAMVRIDEAIPETMLRKMEERGAPMATDGQTIGISINNLHELINMAQEAWLKDNRGVYTNDLYGEIRNIFIHELTHMLCRHSFQGKKYFSERHNKSHEKVLAKELACWHIACEIEANRGHGIDKYHSPVYNVGVTEDVYPNTKQSQYLLDIFHKVMDDYQDQVEKDMEAIQQAIQQAMDEAKEQQKEQNDSPNNETKAQPNATTEGDGQGQPNQSGSGEGQEGEGQGSPQPTSDGDGQQGKQPLKLGDNAVDQQRREALMNLINETMSEEGQDPSEYHPENFDPNAEKSHETIFDAQGAAWSHGGADIDGSFDNPSRGDYKLAEKDFDDWKKNNLRKSLLKLKGTVTGGISKQRVQTYSRQARRDTSDGLLKKGHKRASRNSPKILLALDKSGSMSQTSTKRATEAIAAIFDATGRPTEGCWICLHDGEVRTYKPLKQWRAVMKEFYPSGGNDFIEVAKLANKLGVDIVLNVGDGGDYTTNDKKTVKEFEKAGRKWYDVNIVGIGLPNGVQREREEWWSRVYRHDAIQGGLTRHFIDLTGTVDFGTMLEEIFHNK